nr:MAG TPA: hypothetical protein [Caudoviricetes sp.]
MPQKLRCTNNFGNGKENPQNICFPHTIHYLCDTI